MGTRSAIIVKVGNLYKGIYCHWDGYPTHNGKILLEHYNSQERVEALIALGDLSSLRENLAPPEGVVHTFDKPYMENPHDNYSHTKVTVAYGRDRGETSPDYILPKVGKSPDEVADQIDCAYIYVFRNGRWLYKSIGRKTLKILDEAAVTKVN